MYPPPSLNPYDLPYVTHEGRNGSIPAQMFYVGGNTSYFSQLLLVAFVSAWCVVPVNWSCHYCFLQIGWFRTDNFFNVFFNFALPAVFNPATGGFDGYDAFAIIKNYSLVGVIMVIWFFKFIAKEKNGVPLITMIIHGFLIINIGEAIIWELTNIGQDPHNIINAVAGILINLCVPVFSWVYGVQIKSYDNDRVRQARCNVSPMWIVAYTFWNIEYNAVYHPEKASEYIVATLLVPFAGAFWAGHDWLETRAICLLQVIVLRTLPWGGSDIQIATNGLWEWAMRDNRLHYPFSVLALVTSIISIVEAVLIYKGGKWWNFGLRKEFILFDIAEPYTCKEAVASYTREFVSQHHLSTRPAPATNKTVQQNAEEDDHV